MPASSLCPAPHLRLKLFHAVRELTPSCVHTVATDDSLDPRLPLLSRRWITARVWIGHF